jgi:hypothetical protein
MSRFEFEFGTFLWFYAITFIFRSCGESRLLVSWCVGDRCDMVGSDEDRGRSRRPDAENRGWCHTRFLRPKPDAHRMYAQDQVGIHTVRM